MSDRNLALDFVEGSGAEGGKEPVARVFLEYARRYLGDGSPTLTHDCHSLSAFEDEMARLRAECDAILDEARARFGVAAGVGKVPVGRKAAAAPRASAAAPAKPTGKTPLAIDQRLVVADRMTREVRTLHRNDKLSLADELMKVGRFRHVVVVADESDEVIGVVSQRDIFHGALAWSTGLGSAGHRKVLETQSVKSVMQADVTTIAPDMPLSAAARLMVEQRIGCLPVVEAGKLVGILTEGDFLALLTDSAVAANRV